jgi:hypothetical protein
MSHWPTHCARCAADLSKVTSIVSKFNLDTICYPCKRREKAHLNYHEADMAEIASVRAGDMNFAGVGCPPELYKPPCEAETFAIGVSMKSHEEARHLALVAGAILVGQDANSNDSFIFPDTSMALMGTAEPVSVLVTHNPNRN